MAIVPLQSAANAASAYAQAPQGVSSGLDARDTQSSPFANLLKGAVQQAVTVQRQSEAVSMAAIADNADFFRWDAGPRHAFASDFRKYCQRGFTARSAG